MGSGDLNMKKSWHPALLVNQKRVWEAEKSHAEEKKALIQLRKEREEERQLAELKRMQEERTGKKSAEKLDWMYSAPNSDSNAMGGRLTEHELEQYLLGKRRVDEVLAANDKNVGNTHHDFIAVQNANNARDTAAKVREDPMLAMKKAEQAQLAALMNRPDIRRQLRAAKKDLEPKEDKEERRARRRAEKEERRRDRHERRRRHDDSRSDYSDDSRSRRDDKDRADRHGRDRRDDRERRRSRSVSPRRDRERDARRDDDRRRRDDSPRGNGSSVGSRDRDERSRNDSPRRDREVRGGSHHQSDRRDTRPDDRRDRGHGRVDERPPRRPSPPGRPTPPRRPDSRPAAPSNGAGNGNPLDDQRAARLAAMAASATSMHAERSQTLARRAAEEKRIFEAEEKARSRYHKDETVGLMMKNQEKMSGQIGLGEALQRRGGQGLLRDI